MKTTMRKLFFAQEHVRLLYDIPMTGKQRRKAQEAIDALATAIRPVTETTNQWLKALGKTSMRDTDLTPDQLREFNELLALEVEITWEPVVTIEELDNLIIPISAEKSLQEIGFAKEAPEPPTDKPRRRRRRKARP